MEDSPQESAREEEARKMLAELDVRMAMNRARRESSSGRRNLFRVLGVLMLLVSMVVMVWLLSWFSSRLPEDNGVPPAISKEDSP